MIRRILFAGVFACICGNAAPIQWTGLGANDHWYELVSSPGIQYQAAKTAAAASTYLTLPGHLVTWTTQSEFDFIVSASLINSQTGYWYGAERADNVGTPTLNWNWVNGEGAVPTLFTNTWFIDFFEGSAPYAMFSWYNGGGQVADYIQTGTAYTTGYVVEYDTPTPEPGTAALTLIAGLSLLAWKRRSQRA